MKASRCARRWQVEAVRDQRLSGSDRVAFERHLGTCSECTSELAAFERLEELGARLPVPSSDPLARRRSRNELLRRANDLSVGSGRPPPQRRKLVALGAALAAALALAFVLLRRDDHAVALGAGEPRFELVSAPGSDWSTLRHGAALRLALRRGHAHVSVHKLVPGQSFVLELPDGELEVRGTRFSVEVVERKTVAVNVSEGLVALRLRDGGGREWLLGAGQAWAATASAPAAESASGTATSPAPLPAPSAARLTAAASSAAPESAGASSALAPRKPGASGATRAFAAAMASFSSGDFATAERLFLSFEQRYPTSGHVEDTMFLRALTRLRRGDASGAKTLARAYLERYPNGFRAPEAERLAR